MYSRWLEAGAVAVLMALGGGLLARLGTSPAPAEVEIAGYATSLQGRTASQRHNARQSAEALDGKVIPSGAVFSFNQAVRSWSQDEGYVKAPVSYDGELVKAFGGGVCQTSTTLYNAVLLAGLPIVERHPHVFAPHYVPPGRDAAVAQKNIDLRFRNPYPWPIRLRCRAQSDRIDIRIYGAQSPSLSAQVGTEVLATTLPEHLTRVVHRSNALVEHAYVRNPGAIGYRVLSYRVFSKNGREVRRERLGDDTYQAMDRLVQVVEVSDSSLR